ncbi:hypothetical protein CMK12_17645 [Candidatus Poribacteria bacterium]|nr:hypothetical protein [Candidatus Poribacteria bacterium]
MSQCEGYHQGCNNLGISSRHQCKISKVTVKYNTITNSFSVGILVTSNSSALIEGNRVTDSPEVGIIISNSDKKILLLDNTLQRNRSAGIQCSEASPIYSAKFNYTKWVRDFN